MTRRPGSWLHRSARYSSSSAAQHERAVRALVAVAEQGDSRRLTRMLHPGVVLTVDGGGVVAAPASALEGASDVGGYLRGALLDGAVRLRVESVNGVPGIVVCREGRVAGVLSICVRGRLILEAWLVLNPEKLTHWSC
ncbi:hypothetical protein J2X85_003462 [Microbacterium trichothecenolyticum]|uniref:hypothetical protein n=1 Tax=Microbacterium trichothecenolyticum TaxID=69370 RepID=UPI0028548338|nr:hypothetical protein [Microbacterium trichothecenolyticum]MDR7186426.1 hypothetical protein [Microbacterium trichothecenolyticum]